MDPFSLTIGAISVVAVALHSARRCKELLDSVIDSPRSLQSARKDVVAYYNILSSIEAFTREHEANVHHVNSWDEGVGDEKGGLINELMKGLGPLLKNDVETLGKLETLVRKYTRPSTEVGKVRWSNFKAIFMEKDLKELMERVRYEETTLGLVMSTLNSVQGSQTHGIVKGFGGSIDRIEVSTREVRDFVVVGRTVGDETNAKVHEMSWQIEQLTKKLMKANLLEAEKDSNSVPPPYAKMPDLQETLCSFVGKAAGKELVRGRRPFKEANLVSCHPTDGSIYDGRVSIPDHYTPLVANPVILDFSEEDEELNLAARRGSMSKVVEHLRNGPDQSCLDCEGRSALHEAAAAGHLDIVKLLIENRTEIDATDQLGNTALHYAVWFRSELVAEYLLQAGADVNAQNNTLWTPLHFASFQGNSIMVQVLLRTENRAKVDLTGPVLITALMWAADNGDETILDMVLRAGAQPNVSDRDGQTALHHAAARGYIATLKTLLKAGADIEHRAKNGARPIHIATQYGHAEAVRVLLEFGSDPNADINGAWNPLHSAASRGHVTVIETLLERRWRAYIELRGAYNKTALIWAAEIGQNGSVRALLEKNANVRARDAFQESGLHYAAANGYLDVVMELVKNGADVLGRNARQHQPLHAATLNHGSLYPIVKYLIEKGADVNSKDGSGVTALHNAASFGNKRQARFLLESGADPRIEDNEGESAIDIANAKGYVDMIELLEHYVQVSSSH